MGTSSGWPVKSGGGGGGVTDVTASGVLSSSGGATPNITLTGVVALANGGTGSATQNFVDLTTNQTVAGNKDFTGNIGIGTSAAVATKLSVTGGHSFTNIGELVQATSFSGITFANSSVPIDVSNYNILGDGLNLIFSRVAGGYIDFRESNGPSQLMISSGGAVQMGHYGAGVATFDASGNITSVAAPAAFTILALPSNASVGGAVSEALTVPGLLTTDTILSVSQKTQGAATRASLPLIGWDTVVTGGLTAQWVADPGPGAVVLVAVKR